MLCSSTTHVKLANFTAEVCQLEQNGADTSTTKNKLQLSMLHDLTVVQSKK